MGVETKIQWAHHTFNPWWGCEKISPECKNCYAAAWAKRTGFGHTWGPNATYRTFGDRYWSQPRKWNRDAARAGERRRVFCASMADVFDARAPEGVQAQLFDLIRETRNLDWLLLTKRPERIASSLPPDWGISGWSNVWLGTTVGCQINHPPARYAHRGSGGRSVRLGGTTPRRHQPGSQAVSDAVAD